MHALFVSESLLQMYSPYTVSNHSPPESFVPESIWACTSEIMRWYPVHAGQLSPPISWIWMACTERWACTQHAVITNVHKGLAPIELLSDKYTSLRLLHGWPLSYPQKLIGHISDWSVASIGPCNLKSCYHVGLAPIGFLSNKYTPSRSRGFSACISSRITTVIHVARYHQINYNWFNEPD